MNNNNTGKSFTMGSAAGTSMDIGEFDGIIPRACVDLFSKIQTRCDGNAQVELSYLEIYNEEMRDLLVDDKGSKAKKGKQAVMKVRETLNGEVYVSGLSSRPVDSPKAIGEYMEEASTRRVVASTKMNAVSSRSHAICVLRIKGVLEDSTKFEAKLTLVDLAGSERIKKTGAEGGRRMEGININKGLFVLGQVVSALSETRKKYKRKPPYRDSILTRLLQDSLGGNSRTIMVACVSPADFQSRRNRHDAAVRDQRAEHQKHGDPERHQVSLAGGGRQAPARKPAAQDAGPGAPGNHTQNGRRERGHGLLFHGRDVHGVFYRLGVVRRRLRG
jgi:hypothetical protein